MPDAPPPARAVRAARRLLRGKGRAEAGQFLAEGPQAVREALAPPVRARALFVSAEGRRRHADLVEAARATAVAVHTVDDPLMAELAGTVTPQGVLAVCDDVDVALAEVLGGGPRLLALMAHVRDPGNAGTVIRCADAAGADGVLISTASVDVYNPKAVRASAGSLFHLPVVLDVAVPDVVTALRAAGLRVLAADGSGARDLDEEADAGGLDVPTAWVFGNEAWGLDEEVAAACDAVVRVPVYGLAESLNLASAAAICLYASARAQRRESRRRFPAPG